MEKNREELKLKFNSYVEEFTDKQIRGELINLWEIYESYGKPEGKSPLEFMSTSQSKEIIQLALVDNDMQENKVILRKGEVVLVNFNLALSYLKEVDTYNSFLFIDLLMGAGFNMNKMMNMLGDA
ncbi:hypothetical protein [Carboxylicivirga sp. N1Y90]|uniref:hypothetical protein n=1 Tax=Carboxylicivirga fragile TaxID=3417571 RepID=UPI003D3476A8|nr:hypothetical protein [Marinilabiliaceae bacterium N1Y90]